MAKQSKNKVSTAWVTFRVDFASGAGMSDKDVALFTSAYGAVMELNPRVATAAGTFKITSREGGK